MFCSNCGRKVEQDTIYCPECGSEIQLVPEFVDLDDILYEEDNSEETEGETDFQNDIFKAEKKEEHNVKPKKKQSAKQKNRVLLIQIIGLALLIVLAVTFLIVVMSSQNKKSDTYQLKKAESAFADGKFESALEYYKKAREYNSKNLDVVKGLAKCYYELGDLESAALYYQELAEAEAGNTEVFKTLLEIYSKLDDQESIRQLYNVAKTQSIRDLFASYLLAEPQFSVEAGTYNEKMELTLSLAEEGEIYYTTDGTNATEKSTKYKDPIQLDEGKTVIRAIAITASGQVSDEITKTYEIVFETPKAPGISPESGKYSEPTRIELTIPEGAVAYYTIDGTAPTEESKTCGNSFAMPLGNNIVSVMYIDKNGKTSEIVKRNYNLSMNLSVSTDDAVKTIKTALIQKGEIDNYDGYKLGDNGYYEFNVLAVDKIYSDDYYIIERTKKQFTGEVTFVGYYAYKLSDGKLYKATLDETGTYKLSAF